jgi:CheY-like chemotaxis protein
MNQVLSPNSFPRQFLQLVKQALEHLYDYPYLQRHPLTQLPAFRPAEAGQNSTHLLRRAIIDAIEKLNPGEAAYFRAPQSRLYSLMHLHYVEGMMVQEAAHELGISERQAYRDLRQGEETIAALLWADYSSSFPSPDSNPAILLSTGQADTIIPEEISRLIVQLEPTPIIQLIRGAVNLVEPLANQVHVRLDVELPPDEIICHVDPAIARQVLVNLLSRIVRISAQEQVILCLENVRGAYRILFQYTDREEKPESSLVNPVVRNLLVHLGWGVEIRSLGRYLMELQLWITSKEKLLLVIDDNEGLVDLLERILNSDTIHFLPAQSGAMGLQLARERLPDAIILDVMMSGMDGWEVLQRLKNEPATAQIPVIICSVFNDPELAFSLGAKIFLSKPITPKNVYLAIQQAGLL